ncbi:MAG TPA: cupredoxin family copper-binding protein [Sphingomonas sp.]|uniref:cupredoxin domain-containing protein n=1 Tax=Sphingomonas sp. TaxID=28214 RepID=UPI002BCBE41E|nr:cupredoxin family copper-binding protein [Sphingomonas sp.]HMI20536.1 cupredoxin family copper-binding protein [Sphingomonas sp.]
MSLSSPSVRSVAFLLALSTPMAGILAGQALAAAPAKVSVAIKGFAFVPQVVTVAPGTTVTWTNADEDPHTVVADDKGFRSAALDSDDSYSFTFTKPGDYAYFCSLHPHMTGKIIVKAG